MGEKNNSIEKANISNNDFSSTEDLKQKNYQKISRELALIVEQISGLSIPEKTIEKWKILTSSVYLVDNKVDNISDQKDRISLTQKIILFLNGETIDFSNDKDLEKAMLDIRDLSTSLDEEQKQTFIGCLVRVLNITEEIKQEKNPNNFVTLTRLEGQVFSRIFLPFLSEDFRQQGGYPKLVHALTRIGRASNSLDTLIDLPGDYKDKRTEIKPSVANRILFVGSILSDSYSVLKDIGLSKDLIKKMALVVKSNIETK